MRRIFLVAIALMILVQPTSFAEMKKYYMNGLTMVQSDYKPTYEIQGKDSNVDGELLIAMMHSYFVDIIKTSTDRFFVIQATKKEPITGNIGIVFSKKNPIKIEYEKNGKTDFMVLKKIYMKGTDSVWYKVKKNEMDVLYDANKVTMVFPTKSGGSQRIEVPEVIVQEWRDVLHADMRKEKKALMEE